MAEFSFAALGVLRSGFLPVLPRNDCASEDEAASGLNRAWTLTPLLKLELEFVSEVTAAVVLRFISSELSGALAE